MTETKSRDYEPQDRPYELSADSYTTERVRALLDLVETFKDDVPSFAGLRVYGSLVKGKSLTQEAALAADIDSSMFLDRDILEQTRAEITNSPEFPQLLDEVRKDPSYNTQGMNPETREEFFTQIAIERFVREKAILRIQRSIGSRAPRVAMFVNKISPKDGIFDPLVRHEELYAEEKLRRPEDRKWYPIIAGFFQLDVGGKLSPYRKVFFDRMSQESPERANQLWTVANRNLRGWERISPFPAGLEPFYPTTFATAKQYYAEGGPMISSSGRSVIPQP